MGPENVLDVGWSWSALFIDAVGLTIDAAREVIIYVVCSLSPRNLQSQSMALQFLLLTFMQHVEPVKLGGVATCSLSLTRKHTNIMHK